MPETYKNYIDGKWIESISGEVFEQLNPADIEDITGKFQKSTEGDLRNAVEAAKKAFPHWRDLPPYSRGKILFKAAGIIEKRCEELAEIMTQEMGKTLTETKGEAMRAAQLFEWYGGEAKRLSGETVPSDRERVFLYTIVEPLGIVCLITPWNFPIAIPTWKLGPALVTGNTVIFKPSEYSSLTALKLAEILEEGGLPPGVLNVVTGFGKDLGEEICKNEDIKAISFTGSYETGRTIHRLSSSRMVRTQYEMGGKNPIIILEDGDIDKAADFALEGSMWSAGQKCTATSRAIVVESVAKEFTEKILEKLKGYKVGKGTEEGVRVCPVVNKNQLDKILNYIEKGKEEGAVLLAGGNRLTTSPFDKGYFIAPTIFTGVNNKMTISQEEIFGPVLSIIEVENFEEAIEVANDSNFGLSASIITKNLSKALDYVKKIDAGVVYVNSGTAGLEVQVPFGGMKNSSFGIREQGKEAVKFYTKTKTVYMNY